VPFDPDFGPLLRRSLLAVVVCAILVTLSYFFVDRPVAFFVHDQDFRRFEVLKWLTLPPPIRQAWAPVVLIALAVRRCWGPFRRWEHALLAACVALIVADQFKETLKHAFGRYWPDTWINKNPSLIGDGAYGFHPFDTGSWDSHTGGWYDSFPSGHTARTLALAAVVWIVYPGLRWACIATSVAVAVGLVGMDYHFVGDVIAGGFVGALVGTYTVHFCGLRRSAI
jgi:membrane-associated phospholipid phosphatase